MTNISKQNKMLFKKRVLIILFFLITFFVFNIEVKAAYFNYADFDFDKFAEENKEYWTRTCRNETNEKNEQKCIEVVLAKQRKYYTRLYKLLAKYQKKGYFIDDNIIIATTFFDLTPDHFIDDSTAYNIDPNLNLDNYDIDATVNTDYFARETDTLDLLIRNMFGYVSSCYGLYGEPEQVLQEGSYVLVCPEGSYPNVIDGKQVCASKADSKVVGFWEYILYSSGANSFLGLSNDQKKHCDALGSLYPEGTKYTVTNKQYSPETLKKYWEFLETSEYFDRKVHLRHHFQSILEKTGHKNMSELTADEKELYKDDLIEARKRIVSSIKSILATRGTKVDNINLMSVNNSMYWWPIGGSDITIDGSGIPFAVGEPSSIKLSSLFGYRLDPVYKIPDTFHHGIDIGAPLETNIIAVRDGNVVEINNDCVSYGDLECGSRWGNYIIVSHGDGNYSIYAHIHENTIVVGVGDSVRQGQVIAKVGSSGKSTGPHLHFEIRVGSTNKESAVDPLNYISVEKPRPVSSVNSSFEAMLVCLESAGPDDGGANYVVYNDAYGANIEYKRPIGNKGTLTVGPGVTLIWQKDRFARYGILYDTESDSDSNYYFEGALIPKDIVDNVYYDIITANYDSIRSVLTKNGIALGQPQIDALALFMYNAGSIKDFVEMYKTYGNTDGLYDNFFAKYTAALGSSTTLTGRRSAEWELFHNSQYHTC